MLRSGPLFRTLNQDADHPMQAPDSQLIERVRRRDPAAMNEFFEAYVDRIYAYVLTMTRNATLAEDMVQETFLRLHRALERLDPQRDPTGWVITVAANTVRDHWRSRAHKAQGRAVDFDDLWDEPPDPAGDPSRLLERDRTGEDIREVLETLSPADREVILLRDFEELETREIAEALSLTPEAVRQRHSRAVRRLGEAYRARFGTVEEGP
jgi:RNA polymerase sigma-70 factor (ECF subfamily)